MKSIIKFLRLKWLEIRLLRSYKNAIIEVEVNEIKYRTCSYHIHLFLNKAEKIYEKWYKVRYDK